MNKRDRAHLGRMLEAAKEATHTLQHKERGDLERDRDLTLSLVKALETIGHAASKVSPECRDGCEPVPWETLVEMTHEVIHTYWDIDRDWLWGRITHDIPSLIDALERILARADG